MMGCLFRARPPSFTCMHTRAGPARTTCSGIRWSLRGCAKRASGSSAQRASASRRCSGVRAGSVSARVSAALNTCGAPLQVMSPANALARLISDRHHASRPHVDRAQGTLLSSQDDCPPALGLTHIAELHASHTLGGYRHHACISLTPQLDSWALWPHGPSLSEVRTSLFLAALPVWGSPGIGASPLARCRALLKAAMLWNVMPEPSTSTPSSRSGASASPMRRCACGRAAAKRQARTLLLCAQTCLMRRHEPSAQGSCRTMRARAGRALTRGQRRWHGPLLIT